MRGEAMAGADCAWAHENGPALPAELENQSLAGLFGQVARRAPDGIATIDANGQRLTSYGELAGLVSHWAARLVGQGVLPGQPVGLCASAEREVPLGFLAILSAGAAVVPLDPALPAERLAALIDGLGCTVVLASQTGRDALPADLAEKVQVLALETVPEAAPAPVIVHDPQHIAVIYHTSGSTGLPKPVALTHATLAARILSMAQWFGITGDEVVCAGSTLAFDPFLQQLFFALSLGGTLWLPQRETLLDPGQFWPQAAALRVTHLNLVPSQVEALLIAPPAAFLPKLRRVVMGGESVAPALPRRMAEALGAVAIYNMYGPTEATVDATGHRIDPHAETAPFPIGQPLPGCCIRILDDSLVRVAMGEVGEVCIGGAGLAVGYLNREQDTARAFIADPFGRPGDRLYRTGDHARWREDGRLVFVGRQDDQVKIRGQRLELGEIEAAIRAFPGVTAAAIGKWDDCPGGPALLAHVSGAIDTTALRRWLAERLPAAAVPAWIMALDSLPVQPSGKIDRRALPKPKLEDLAPPPRGTLERRIGAVWNGLLGHSVDVQANLFETGAHSLLVPAALTALEAATGRPVSAIELFRYPSIAALARYLSQADTPHQQASAPTSAPAARSEIAVIGMAMRLPGASDRETLWQRLQDADVDCLRRYDVAVLRQDGAPQPLIDHPAFVPVHGAIDDTENFDAQLFGYSLGEAAEIDPQQRLLLHLAWQALEDAACDPAADGPVGVFTGVGFNAYLLDNLHHRAGFGGGAERFSVVVGGDKDFAALRIAYKLGLTGPAMTISSACSTALSALTVAVDSLRAGRCRVALVGAASLGMFSPFGHIHAEGGIASRQGVCRPFDAQADGTVAGAGAAFLVLKRLNDAVADGDTIHATLLGVGMANDGQDKAAFAAPSVDGQAAAIRAALADAATSPQDIGFVEGHGTATVLGDPIEVAALNLAYGGAAANSIRLGSIKGHLGHLDTAAGMAGLIKAILAVGRGQIPPTAHFAAANPRIPFAQGPFYVNSQTEPWDIAAGGRRLAGVSAFGMGGTNIHVIVGQAPPSPLQTATAQTAPALLCLSAATPTALDKLAADLAGHLQTRTEHGLNETAAALARRRPLRHRRAVAASSAAEAAALLSQPAAAVKDAVPAIKGSTPAIALLFPGQGAQRPGMARALYEAVAAFRQIVDDAHALVQDTPLAGLRALLLAADDDEAAAATLAETQWTQPALFVTSYATAMALQAHGLRPALLAGHSVGEYVAACLAGVMDFAHALHLVGLRGRLIAQAPRGAMLAVSMAEDELTELLQRLDCDLAAVNANRQCVAGGTIAAIERLAAMVSELGRPCKRLAVSHAFHTRLLDGIVDEFVAALAQVPLAPPRLTVISTLTGRQLTAAEATDPAYWGRHLRGTVRFAAALSEIAADPATLLVECGPGTTLTRLARAAGISESRAIASQPAESGNGHGAFLHAVGRVWCAGGEIDRLAAAGRSERRVDVPTYPFEGVRLWIPPQANANNNTNGSGNGNAITVDIPTKAPKTATPPRTGDLETTISTVWSDVLGIAHIGADDDFLALGGDSLIAVRIAARLSQVLGRQIEAAALFRATTIAALANQLADHDVALQPATADFQREEGWL